MRRFLLLLGLIALGGGCNPLMLPFLFTLKEPTIDPEFHKLSSEDKKKVIFRPVKGDASTWKSYFERHHELGIHWIIDRSGTIVSSIPEDQVANHAAGWNRTSIGIELVNTGDGVDPYPQVQIDTLTKLIVGVRSRWGVVVPPSLTFLYV